MKTVNIHEAKTHLSRLIERARCGEEITIAKDGNPVVRLVPVDPPRGERKPGAWRDELWLSDDFEAPLSGDVMNDFESSGE